jgi:glutaredoxin
MEEIMSNVIIYTKTGCPYCAKARGWYTAEGIEFEERNAQDNTVYRQRDARLLEE